MTRKKKKEKEDQYKFEYKPDRQSRLAKIQRKRKKKEKEKVALPNDRDQIVFNPLREGRAPHHSKRPSPMVAEDVKKLKDNTKIIKKK